MKKICATALAIACTGLIVGGCGSGTEDAAPATSATTRAPLAQAEVSEYRQTLFDQFEACEGGKASTSVCTPAIDKMVATLTDFGSGVPDSMANTKASVATTIESLEYWRDNCIIGSDGKGDRAKCIKSMPAAETVQTPIWEWIEENPN